MIEELDQAFQTRLEKIFSTAKIDTPGYIRTKNQRIIFGSKDYPNGSIFISLSLLPFGINSFAITNFNIHVCCPESLTCVLNGLEYIEYLIAIDKTFPKPFLHEEGRPGRFYFVLPYTKYVILYDPDDIDIFFEKYDAEAINRGGMPIFT